MLDNIEEVSLKFFWGFIIILLGVLGARLPARSTRFELPFAQQKVVLNLNSIQTLALNKGSAINEMIIPAGFDLSVLIDNSCRMQNSESQFMRNLTAQSPSYLREQAYKLKTSQSQSYASFVDSMNAEPCVVGVGEEFKLKAVGEFTSDPLIAQQTHIASLEADEAYRLFFGSSFKIANDVIIAIVDTGVDYNHTDLRPRMWQNAAGAFGRDIVNNDADPIDDQGHGTHVAGLAAASAQNGIGGTGVMGVHSRIMAVKVLGSDGSGSVTDIANGIQFAIDNGADVINLSLGAAGVSATLENAVAKAIQAGITVVVAAGNDGVELTAANTFVPASYAAQMNGLLSVGAYDTTNRGLSTFSNFSSTYVEIAAPGSQGNSAVGILSTLPNGQYGQERGTSMASPIVAGAAALIIGILRQINQPATPEAVENIIKEGALADTQLQSSISGGRRLNLKSIARYLQNQFIFQGQSGLESY